MRETGGPSWPPVSDPLWFMNRGTIAAIVPAMRRGGFEVLGNLCLAFTALALVAFAFQ
ncbi:MAG: hypothetical protein JNM30_05000 [Rhodospirillales bacterium]|nr:hypothetical protein [Rhodospirillales bacterium]